MARVSVEQKVWGDARYRVLARELGVDVWSAIGRMAALWNQCQETESYVLSEAIVNSMFDDAPLMSDALLKSELGKKHRHGIYISGTRGRIEWLVNKRANARENGKLGGRPKITDEEPKENQDRLREKTPLTLALTPVSTHGDSGEQVTVAVPSEQVNKKSRATRLPEGWYPPKDVIDVIKAECPGLDLRAEHRVFADHWRSAPGSKGVKLDWEATWRNWMRKAFRDRGPGPRTPRPPATRVMISAGEKAE